MSGKIVSHTSLRTELLAAVGVAKAESADARIETACTGNVVRRALISSEVQSGSQPRHIGWSILAWLAVGVFWFIATRNYHPTRELAAIVTASLITAYAAAAYTNQLVLVPRLWRPGRHAAYAAALLGVMVLLTGAALAVICTSYVRTLGPDPDPNGVYKHFGIDFFGMAIHVLAAAGVVWAW